MNFNNNLEKQMKPLLNTARPHRDGFCTVMCAARHKLPTTAANILNTKHLSVTKNLLFYSLTLTLTLTTYQIENCLLMLQRKPFSIQKDRSGERTQLASPYGSPLTC